MTISSQTRQAGPFTGNGATTAFPFAFKVFATADLVVVRTDLSGVDGTLVLGTDYTVALNPDQNANPGGTITLPVALATGFKLTATSGLANLQPTDLTNQGGFYPRVINDALDRLTILVQQLANGLGRALKFPISDGTGGDPTMPGKDLRKGRVLAFHETTGDPVQGPSIADVGTVAGNVASINTVANDIGNVNTVAGSIGGVNTVAGSIGNVNTVAANIADVNTAAANMAAIIDAPAQAAAAAGSAAAAAASYDEFDDRYLGAKSTAPTTDNDGDPLLTGATYWDTPSSQMFTWNGTSWRPTFLIGNTVRTVVTATAGQTVVPAPTYLVGSNTLQVFVNGVKLLLGTDYTETTQNSITFTAGLTLNDEVELIAQQAFAVDELRADLAFDTAGKGSALVAFKQAGTGSVPRTVDGKLKEMPSALDFGADPTGITDSTLAIQAFINAGGGHVSPGIYNISSTLVLKNRITIDGPKDSWSPSISRNAIFKWTGVAGGNIVQASTTAIGTQAASALTSVRFKNITIDGDNVAGVGLFINYASNESVFDNVTVIKCSIGIVAGKLWYCRLSNLTARNCSAMGMSIGAQYLGSFDTPQVNSLRMDNLRASNCGSRYDASTNPFGFGSANLRGGCGIYLNMNVATFVTQITSENNYGPGLVFGGSFSNSINGIYLENNAAGAVADGEIAKRYGLILLGFASSGTKAINTLYMHPANANIYVDDITAVNGVFVIDAANYIEAIDSASGTNRLIKILNPEMVVASDVGYPLQNAEETATAFDATYEGTVNTATNSASLRNSRTTIKAFAKQFDWASASTITVCTVNVDCGGQTAGSAGSVLLNVNIGTGVAGTSYDSHSFTYLVSFAAWQLASALTTDRIDFNITQLGTVNEKSATLLSNLTLSAVKTITATSRATIELQLTPTSTGTQVRNSVSASAVFLSGGLASIGRPSRIV